MLRDRCPECGAYREDGCSWWTLRAALQDIADGNVPNVTFADDDLISEFARRALEADGAS